jgi:hypothetical protein
MARVGRLIISTGIAVGVLGGALVAAAGTAQAQGVIGGSGFYTPTGQSTPVGPVNVGQFPALGVVPPYNPATIGIPQTVDITVLRGRADATSPVIGQFPLAFMGPAPVR